MKKIFLTICCCFLVFSITNAQNFISVKGNYRAVLTGPGGDLPFRLSINYSSNPASNFISNYTISNDKEDITGYFGGSNYFHGDSIVFNLPVFNTEIVAQFSPDKRTLSGYWYDHSRPGKYYLPFHAEMTDDGNMYRFIKTPLPPKEDLSGKWDTWFYDPSDTEYTVGIFEQKGNHLTGTFLTTTGDYRFLEGDVSADSFYLSTFDGSHAFLFKGKINDDGTLSGNYWSGKHYHATFTSKKNDNAALPDPTTLTHLKNPDAAFDFTFPDENGKLISLHDAQFKNKVVIVTITGSWCPNCMDEASYLSEFYKQYQHKGVEIIALSFERQTDSVNFKKNIDKLKDHFGTTYTILNAGSVKNASDALPQLNEVMGFPTALILDKQHKVREIYTGFNGPATGNLYVQFQKDFEHLIDQLLR